jgi:hypothetical protein
VVDTLAGRMETPAEPVPLSDSGAGGSEATPEAQTAPETAQEPDPELSPQEQALEALTTAIAPPEPPSDLPFADIGAVLEAYAFDELPGLLGDTAPPIDEGLASYLGTHWTRFMTTLRQIEGLEVSRALDVGVFPPLVFQALMANRFPAIQQDGLWEGPNPYRQTIRPRSGDHAEFDIRLEAANSERGVWKMLNGIAPYSFGIFVPSGGVYGRHNREYAPAELPELGQSAGFETVSLSTHDVYDRRIDPGIAELLVSRGDNLAMRGETIFYLARKSTAPQGAPARLYHGDPVRMSGALRVTDTETQTGLTRITVENHSPAWWSLSGDRATCLLAEWIDPEGDLRHQHLMQPLTGPVGPQSATEIALRLDPQNTEGQGVLRLHLYQAGVGVMTGSGRARTLSLPCSESAFLHMVRSVPLPGAGA